MLTTIHMLTSSIFKSTGTQSLLCFAGQIRDALQSHLLLLAAVIITIVISTDQRLSLYTM